MHDTIHFYYIYYLPSSLLIVELWMSGQVFSICRLSSLAHTIKAFIGLLT